MEIDGDAPMTPIEVANLKKYYGNIKAVDGISFSINEGEVFALLGPNGAGKTTTIEILEGLRKSDGGEVKVLGLDPWENGYKLHLRIGVIPQEFTFFDKTSPREAIIYYASLFDIKTDPDEILKEVLLEDSANTLFENLSGGQKRKMGLALSLVNSPELLFLDERTIVLTTHYLDEAQQLSDRVAIMDHGHIVARGTSEEIIREHGSGERLEIKGTEDLANFIRTNTDLQVEFHNGVISVPLKQKNDVLRALEAAERSKLEWGEFRLRRDTLDDVFVKLVSGTMDERGEYRSGTDAKPFEARRG
jgi:ABC-2 type transport system ATP-binding protein